MKKFFEFEKHRASVSTEVLAGITTFLTMSYILVVQPSVLSVDYSGNPTGLEPGAVLLATCLSSAFASAFMGFYAKLPIALAPGMGANFFFISVIVSLGAAGLSSEPWKAALAIVFVSGVLFLVLTLLGVRKVVLDIMSLSMRTAISAGIGAFIAFIGLKNAGVIADGPTFVELNAEHLYSIDSGIFWLSLIVTLALVTRKVPGSILIGMVVAGVSAYLTGRLEVGEVVGLPQFEQSAILQFDFSAVFTAAGMSSVVVFLFINLFDTTGTLVGVTQQAGLLEEDGTLPRMNEAMIADSAGTIAGACVGTSTVTSFIESAAGVQLGGRTGLTAVTVAVLFLMAIFFSPLIIAIGTYPPITAPALVIVGAMMFRSVALIDWNDDTEAIPAFLVILGIPLFFSIADGIALGLIVWPILKLARGKTSDVSPAAIVLAALLVGYFLFIRSGGAA